MKNLIPIFLLIFIAAVSCKKNKNSNTNHLPGLFDAKIASVVVKEYDPSHNEITSLDSYRITYNSQDIVDSMIDHHSGYDTFNVVTKFNYYNGYYKISYYPSNPYGNPYTIGINDKGLITYMLGNDHYYTTSDSFLIRQNSYNANGQLRMSLSFNRQQVSWNGYIENIDTAWSAFTWNANGNNDTTLYYDTNDTAYIPGILSYDLSKNGQTGDLYRIGQFLSYGRSYLITKNVHNSNYTNAYQHFINYQYDGQGRITNVLTLTSNDDTLTYSYVYY